MRRSHSDQEPADRVSAKIGAKRPGTGKKNAASCSTKTISGDGGHLRKEVNMASFISLLLLMTSFFYFIFFLIDTCSKQNGFNYSLFNFRLIRFPV